MRPLLDPALVAAGRRLARLWRPMAAWSALVWTVVATVLAPLSSTLLGWSWLRGREDVVANEALLGWMLTPQGLLWLVVAGSLALVGTVLHFAGIFEIVTEEMEGVEASVPETVLRLVPEVPALVRLCGAAVLAGLLLALPAAAGLSAIHGIFLGAQDINYYLAERPPAWWYALGSAAAWLAAWTGLAAWLAGRSVLALPAHLDGHPTVRASVRRSWRSTRGEGARMLRILAVAVGVWLLARGLLSTVAVAAGAELLGWTASVSTSLGPLVAATGAWALVSLTVDATVGFLGIAYLSTVVTKLYHEDTDLRTAAPAPAPDLPARLSAGLRRWTRPRRLLPAAAVALAVSTAAGARLLERLPDPRPVAVTAHRAGPAPAPENSFAALDSAVAAGADWSEIDVQLTRDGVPVLLHDADLLRVAGDPRRVSRVTLRELREGARRADDPPPSSGERIPRLGAFLDRARGRIGVAVELKYYAWDPALAPTVARILRERADGARVMVMSLEQRAVRQIRELLPDVPVGYAAAAAVGDPTRLPVDFLALSRRAATADVLRRARRRGIDVHVWTVNRPAAMAEVIQDGVDGLITDRPAVAVRVREELAQMSTASRLLLRFGGLLSEAGDAEGARDEL